MKGQQIDLPLYINDLDRFVAVLMDWHQTKVKVLEHLLEIPEGAEVVFNEGATQELTGDLRQGFLIGLSVALIELGNLPFAVEESTETSDAPTQH